MLDDALSLSLSEISIPNGRWIPYTHMQSHKTDTFLPYIRKALINPHAEETIGINYLTPLVLDDAFSLSLSLSLSLSVSLSLSEIYIPNHR